MIKAERMLTEAKKEIGEGIPCILLTNVDYRRWDGVQVFLSKGDKVYVDKQRGWAVNGDDHFTISINEYRSLLVN